MLPKHDIVGSNPITRSTKNRGQERLDFLLIDLQGCCHADNFALSVKFTSEKALMMPEAEKGTILYVEDNSDNRSLIRRVLGAEGYTVIEAINATQAVEKLEHENPNIDLILMDINMPDMDGYTLTAKIKGIQKFSNIPIIAVTANVMRGDREKSLDAGCDGYIQKPIDIDTLGQQIERFIIRRNDV